MNCGKSLDYLTNSNYILNTADLYGERYGLGVIFNQRMGIYTLS